MQTNTCKSSWCGVARHYNCRVYMVNQALCIKMLIIPLFFRVPIILKLCWHNVSRPRNRLLGCPFGHPVPISSFQSHRFPSSPTIRVLVLRHQRQDSLGVLKRLRLARRSGILTVVRQLCTKPKVADRVATNKPKNKLIRQGKSVQKTSFKFSRKSLFQSDKFSFTITDK